MESKKKITISFRNHEQKEQETELVKAEAEQAAAKHPKEKKEPILLEDSSEQTVYKLPMKKKNNLQSPVKRIAVTALTALIISFGLGFLLLRMFVTLTDETTTGEDVVPATSNTPVDEQGEVVQSVNPAAIDSYFIQAGVFTTEEKALEWKMKLTSQSVSSVVWERDGQFYLFAGSAPTKSEADTLAVQLQGYGVETYVKNWVVLKEEGSLSEEEADVMNTLVTQLEQHTLSDMSADERESLITELNGSASGEPLIKSLQNWENTDTFNLNWLKVAYGLEEMMK
ncbi:SPOR domain-containing protein [Halobacillus mangrovi]|uniref:SPOR domain-containing protein n=1 Tax=Halobacillus mangrovi TaxID=402384 RepID=UPI003D97230B